MNSIFLLDNSVTQRIHRSETIAAAVVQLLDAGDLGSCLPQLLEEGYSAQSAMQHHLLMDASRRARIFLPPDEEVAALALGLQSRLFDAGIGRSVGVSDLQIAATALRHTTDRRRVTVVHYDVDFERVADVEPSFSHRWIVPRGSVD